MQLAFEKKYSTWSTFPTMKHLPSFMVWGLMSTKSKAAFLPSIWHKDECRKILKFPQREIDTNMVVYTSNCLTLNHGCASCHR